MGCLIKIIAILIPITIIIGSVFLGIQAVEFWISVSGPSQVIQSKLDIDSSQPYEIYLFVPERIQPRDSPIPIDVKVVYKGSSSDVIVVRANLLPQCDYVRIIKSSNAFNFGQNLPSIQTHQFSIETRNMRPPSYCELLVQIFEGSSEKPFSSGSANIPIDAWTGHVIAVGKLLLSIIGTIIGIIGTLGLL